jgi:serine/threonine-protein kinase
LPNDADIEDALRRRGELRIGETLRGKYRLDRVIGCGGMAVVYEATHRNQKQFAVKMLHPELSLRADIRTRFLREGYAANSVKHPGAVAVLDDDAAADGAAFLVMELLEGEPVEEMCTRLGGTLEASLVLNIAYQLLDVLAAAHAKSIIHRDVKPANMFATKNGQVKVLDFGIARVRDAASSGGGSTGSGFAFGTPAYMAPEQALAKSAEMDGRTDVWAVGATMFALLAGRTPHVADNASQLLVLAATTEPASLATVLPDAPTEIIVIVDRALKKERDQRWADASAMRDAIAAVHEKLFGRVPSAEDLAPVVHVSRASLSKQTSADISGDATVIDSSQSSPDAVVRLDDSDQMAATKPSTVPSVTPPVTQKSAEVGSTTDAVYSDRTPKIAEEKPATRKSARYGVVAMGLVACVAIAGVFAFRGRDQTPTPKSSASLGVDSPPASAPERATPVASAPAQAPAAASASALASASAPASASASATASPSTAAMPVTTVHHPSAGAKPPPPVASPSASASVSKDKCPIQTTFDADGQPHFTRVCQ